MVTAQHFTLWPVLNRATKKAEQKIIILWARFIYCTEYHNDLTTELHIDAADRALQGAPKYFTRQTAPRVMTAARDTTTMLLTQEKKKKKILLIISAPLTKGQHDLRRLDVGEEF